MIADWRETVFAADFDRQIVLGEAYFAVLWTVADDVLFCAFHNLNLVKLKDGVERCRGRVQALTRFTVTKGILLGFTADLKLDSSTEAVASVVLLEILLFQERGSLQTRLVIFMLQLDVLILFSCHDSKGEAKRCTA
jgi:hypothetical protein